MKYPLLFSEGVLGKRTTKNRIVMAPMGDDMANADGSVSDQAIAYYGARAKGGTAVIIPGVVSVEYPRGKTIPCQHRLDEIKYVKDYARLAQEIHRYGSLLIPQIHHAGASTDLLTTEGIMPVGVSVLSDNPEDKQVSIAARTDEEIGSAPFHVLTTEEVKELEGKFVQTALYAQMANCDGVEIHGAHGYLISQFLNKKVNLRKDEYGGDIVNRGRFAINIIEAIRKACGPNFIIGIRIPVHNWETDGLTDEESIELAKMCEKAGCDYLNLSGGFTPSISLLLETQRYPQGARLILADKIKEHVSIPVMSAGLVREPDFCEKALADGRIDFALMGRTLIADPEWGNKAKSGRTDEIRRCISCLDACYGDLAKAQAVQCVINPSVGIENHIDHLPPAKSSKNVVIIGGGISGMQAAITASERGHRVTLIEKAEELGGQLKIASVPPNKSYINWATEWFVGEVSRQKVNVILNRTASPENIIEMNPDVVLLATGAEPMTPSIPGIETGIQSWDILKGTVETPQNQKVIVLGGGVVGCETALYLAKSGCEVNVIEMLPDFATGLEGANKLDLVEDFKQECVRLHLSAKVDKIENGKVYYNDTDVMECDSVVIALGQRSVGRDLKEALENNGIEVKMIGDAVAPRKFLNATQEGFFAAISL